MHAKRKTVMQKDGQLIRKLFNLWDANCFLAQESKLYRGRTTWDGPPRSSASRSSSSEKNKEGRKHRTKQTAAKSTEGKASNFGKQLAAKANRVRH